MALLALCFERCLCDLRGLVCRSVSLEDVMNGAIGSLGWVEGKMVGIGTGRLNGVYTMRQCVCIFQLR